MSHSHNPNAQPIETSHYTYAAHRPAALATRNLINQDPTQHSPTSPCGPTTQHEHHEEHHEDHHEDDSKSHPEHQTHESSPHPHPHPHHHHHRHPTQHHIPGSPDSSIASDSIQSPQEFGGSGGSEGGGFPQRRQSWNREEMKRGVMEGLLEKGKGKQAKGGYSSTS